MKLWLLEQTHNDGYDTYDSAVVAAPDEQTAKAWPLGGEYSAAWVTPKHVTVTLIGTAVRGTKAGVVCASFNAG